MHGAYACGARAGEGLRRDAWRIATIARTAGWRSTAQLGSRRVNHHQFARPGAAVGGRARCGAGSAAPDGVAAMVPSGTVARPAGRGRRGRPAAISPSCRFMGAVLARSTGEGCRRDAALGTGRAEEVAPIGNGCRALRGVAVPRRAQTRVVVPCWPTRASSWNRISSGLPLAASGDEPRLPPRAAVSLNAGLRAACVRLRIAAAAAPAACSPAGSGMRPTWRSDSATSISAVRRPPP